MPRIALPIQLDPDTRDTLNQFIRSSSTPQSLALRSRIVLAAADGSTNQQIAASLRIPAITVGKWRRSFAIDGLEGLRDAPRPGRPPRHDLAVRHSVQTRVCQQPEAQGRWTVRTLAAELGLPSSTVHSMLVAAKIQPHRIRTFTFSPDPDFEAKLLDIIALYLNPPENALVLCVDEKPSIQALDRTQPVLPLRAKKPRSWTNEYARHGTQTLLAALEIATGKVVAHVRDRRTTADFLSFMDDVLKSYPQRELHVVLDNLNIHKMLAVRDAIEAAGATPIYLPTYSPELNPIELLWADLKRDLRTLAINDEAQLRRAVRRLQRRVPTRKVAAWFGHALAHSRIN